MASRSRRRFRARFGLLASPSIQRAQGKPGARCTRGLACKIVQRNAHEHTGSAEAVRPSLRNGFTAYNALSPATGLSCHCHWRKLVSANLMPASGHQDHTPSPSASSALVSRTLSVHRTPLRVRDVAQRPSVWDGMARNIELIWVFGKSEYFFQRHWTRRRVAHEVICPTRLGKNSDFLRIDVRFCS
jgi:hypothetical protein